MSQIRPHPRGDFRRWCQAAGGLLLLAGLLPVSPARAQVQTAAVPDRVVLTDSHKPLLAPGKAAHPSPTLTRATLTSSEASAPLTIEVALRMPHWSELQARVHRGEKIPVSELAEHYQPASADYKAVIKWLTSQGLTITRTDSSQLAVFARGTPRQLAAAFQVTFARVTAQGTEWTSAITAPSLPAALAGAVLGVNGLQPHLRPHPHILPAPKPLSTSTTSAPAYWPKDLLLAYGGSNLSQTGQGQTIGIVIDTFPAQSDLEAFWATIGSPQTFANMQFVQVVPGTLPAPSGEETLDVEWSSGIASGATIRLYAATDLAYPDLDACYAQVLSEISGGTQPNLHQLSMSFGQGETEVSPAQLETDEQYFAELTAAGVSLFASTGDTGSNPDGVLQVEAPASSTSVTAVGGTSLQLDPGTGAVTSESVWNNSIGATGGGVSTVFPRPVWQVGVGVPAGTMRVVPDVAASADPNWGALVYLNGFPQIFGGTSWGSPSWAAFCALFNQARATASLPPLGLLGPNLYPLLFTSSFRDITSGGNGAYSTYFPTSTAAPGTTAQIGAGLGFDPCTGLGVPNLAAMSAALLNLPLAPAPPSTFQWARLPAGATTWSNVTDSAPYSGSATATLSVAAVTASMSGDQFRCTVTNSSGFETGLSTGLLVALPCLIQTVAGIPGMKGSTNGSIANATFNFPNGIAADSADNIYLGDMNNDTIRLVTPAGMVSVYAGQTGGIGFSNSATATGALFNGPAGVATDTAGNVYVADYLNNAIRLIAPSGAVSLFAGNSFGEVGFADDPVGANALFSGPADLAVDSAGNVYVADQENNAIRMITPAGAVTTLAGSGFPGSADGVGPAASFNQPGGIGIDHAGNLYIADSFNQTVRKITMPGAVVSTLAGTPGIAGTTDGITGAQALFFYPGDVQPDANGNVYVIDSENNTVREILASGAVVTVAGVAGSTGSADGLGPAARFNGPGSIILEPSGTFAIANTTANTVRRAIQLVLPSVQLSSLALAQVVTSNAIFTAAVTGTPAPACQWQRFPAGGTGWVNLTDNATYNGSATPTLTVFGLTFAMSGDQFQCVVTNAAGTATSSPATLTVQSTDTFAAWQAANFTTSQLAIPAFSGPAAVLGPDSSTNLLKYALGVAPTSAVPASRQLVSISGGVNTYTYLRPAYTTDLTYTVQMSSDLQTWTSTDVSQQLISTDPTTDLQTWQSQLPATTSAVFFRLLITAP